MRTTDSVHCGNLTRDRRLGDIWESNFCGLLPDGCSFIRHQKDRNAASVFGVVDPGGVIRLSPSADVSVWWGRGITTHHEIKHKNATRGGLFGLERYRINSLCEFMQRVGQDVHYTIHDHDCSGGPHGEVNDIKHWLTLSLQALLSDVDDKRKSASYRNSDRVMEMTYYWHRSRFNTLEDEFDNLTYFARRESF
jgi:hypothetical protein